LVEWWEPIVAFLKDWSLIFATVGLVVATFYLAKQTKATASLTRATITASNALQTMPSLIFNLAEPLSDGGGQYSRFSVKNVGYGHAKNPTIKVKTQDGRDVTVRPLTQTNIIEVNGLFHWDAFGVHVGDVLLIEITFTDIRGVQYPPFHASYTVF
jgi:hypothetical protein